MKKLLLLIILPILFQGSLWSAFKEVPAYWDGKCFHQCDAQQVALSTAPLKERALYFSVEHMICYGHALLDGILPLYAMLKEHDLLNTPLTLLLETSPFTLTNATLCNILQFLEEVFHFNQIIIISHATASLHIENFIVHDSVLFSGTQLNPISFYKEAYPESFGYIKALQKLGFNHNVVIGSATDPFYIEKLILHDNVPFSGTQSSSFSFYRAYPESFEYIRALQKLGFRENIVFQDTEIKDNIVKDFVNFVLKAYNIDLPLIKNRILLTNRPHSRRIINLDELSQTLKNQGYQITVVDFEKLPIKQQIIETIQSEYLMGTCGSNLVNAIFLKPQANVVVLWHKYAKYFWSRRGCIIHSAFLSMGVRLIEYDKPEYDERDVYLASIHAPEYFYREKNMNQLREEKLDLDAIIKYPLPAMFEIYNVDLYIDPNEIIDLLNQIKV